MITNFDTNKVYLAKGMKSEKYVNATGHLLGALHNHKISWDFLPLTASPLHIWTRDYMPVQVSKEKFVRFNYSPDYLKLQCGRICIYRKEISFFQESPGLCGIGL